ncbi:MAG TPA: DUF29 domain-containing protein [Burkholderiales bacterium]|nr:DUF29 domain-containing protein [Burkholderiales bacterium]
MSASTKVMVGDLYEQDFYAWAIKNAQLIRGGQFSQIDASNVAEELESMGRRERRELFSRMRILLAHLLKWAGQPEERSTNWKATITTQRSEIECLLRDSPSLKRILTKEVSDAYVSAVALASVETGLRKSNFPADCPYALEQFLNDDFWPDKSLFG